jgi:hypothetical protein
VASISTVESFVARFSPCHFDCYRRGRFVLDAKNSRVGADGTATKVFDDALLRAQSQAGSCARAETRQAWPATLPDILAAVEARGRARRLDDGRWLG